MEAYCHQMYHLLVNNTSNQVCHNCILIIHTFSRVCTIVLQLLHNLPINPNVCFLIIASKLYIYHKLHNDNDNEIILFGHREKTVKC